MALAHTKQSRLFPIRDASDAGDVRRNAAVLAMNVGLGEEETGRASIVATEAASNLARYAKKGVGCIILRPLECGAARGIEILSLDKGPGMANSETCLTDGYSTGGTAGTGLGAMRRLSHVFDLHSVSGLGTAVLSQIWESDAAAEAARKFPEGGICLPVEGEVACGDDWALRRSPNRIDVLVVDGLGHGPLAAAASQEAVRIFEEVGESDPMALMERVHGALRSTRGAAVAILEVDLRARELRYVGVGNISATFLGRERRLGMPNANGTVGHAVRKIQEFIYPYSEGALVIHSDGIATRWDLSAAPYTALLKRHPALVAGVLYRDFSRDKDDRTVVVLPV
jgi:anti-sigma regulatory factor (Ser/Thr protein kinase)